MAAAALRSQFLIGCSGWYYRHWEGLYPRGEPSHRWFKHYTDRFPTVELNAPFYRWPKPETVRRWKRAAPDGFIYSVKVNGAITHERRFTGTKRLIREFCSLGETLGAHMGCFLFQTPGSFRYSAPRLRRILDQLDTRWRNVLEFRHRGWWNEEAFEMIREASAGTPGIIFCTTSGPRLPRDVVVTAPDVYVRFHGVKRWYRHDYTRDELREWKTRLRASGARRVYAYFNNDRDGFALENAEMLRRVRGVSTDTDETPRSIRRPRPSRRPRSFSR